MKRSPSLSPATSSVLPSPSKSSIAKRCANTLEPSVSFIKTALSTYVFVALSYSKIRSRSLLLSAPTISFRPSRSRSVIVPPERKGVSQIIWCGYPRGVLLSMRKVRSSSVASISSKPSPSVSSTAHVMTPSRLERFSTLSTVCTNSYLPLGRRS